MEQLPEEITDYLLLQKLPGYTRASLNLEPAWVVRRWLILMDEEGKQAKYKAKGGAF